MSDTLNKYNLGLNVDSVLKAYELVRDVLAPKVNAYKDAVKGSTKKLRAKLETEAAENESSVDNAESIVSEFFAKLQDLEKNGEVHTLVHVLDRLESIVDWTDSTIEESASASIVEANEELANEAKQAYAEYETLHEFVTNFRNLVSNSSMLSAADKKKLDKGITVKTRKVRGGATAELIDYGTRIYDPNKLEEKKKSGGSNVTRSLPIFTVDGQDITYGTTLRELALKYLSTEESPIIAKDVREAAVASLGDKKLWGKKAWHVTINGKKVSATAHMTQEEYDTAQTEESDE